ncbi:hypothetical protein J3D48_004163 [Pseudomonas fluorescens]|nr:hypothetical protein [Pseudomonas fluorescens]
MSQRLLRASFGFADNRYLRNPYPLGLLENLLGRRIRSGHDQAVFRVAQVQLEQMHRGLVLGQLLFFEFKQKGARLAVESVIDVIGVHDVIRVSRKRQLIILTRWSVFGSN